MQNLNIPDILENVLLYEKLYKEIRFVDPIQKKVLTYEKGSLIEADENCYDCWNRNEPCTNCVSLRAIKKNETCVKIEYSPSGVTVVTAVPVVFKDRKIIVELISEASEIVSSYVGRDSYEDIRSMLNDMNDLASRDSLTGVFNRRYLDENLTSELCYAKEENENLAVIMVDLDRFKTVNDKYGHLAGDKVLQTLADILITYTKVVNGWVSRYGGEEFIIVIPKINLNLTKTIAESLRKLIEETEISYKGNRLQVTASFGVVNVTPTDDLSIEKLIEEADRKLYLAKNNGRNRIEY